jgi:hypothetical protein
MNAPVAKASSSILCRIQARATATTKRGQAHKPNLQTHIQKRVGLLRYPQVIHAHMWASTDLFVDTNASFLGYKLSNAAWSIPDDSYLYQRSRDRSRLSALSFQPSAFSFQPSAFSHQLSAFSHQLSAFSHQLSAISFQLSAFSFQFLY